VESWYKEFYTDSSSYDVKFYFINLNINDSNTYIYGNVTIKAQVQKKPLSYYAAELNDSLAVDSMLINGRKITYKRRKGLLIGEIEKPIKSGAFFEVTIYYKGYAIANGSLGGVQTKKDDKYHFNVTSTLAESFYASYWIPCKQELTDKIDSVYCYITVPSGRMAASNGLLKRVVELPNHEVRFEWESRYPIDYYLIFAAVSNYRDYSFQVKSMTGKSFLLQNYIYNNDTCFNDNKADIDKTPAIMNFFESIIGAYPFINEKYGQVMAPIGGGMENQTMTTLVNFEFSLVAHELAHSWFGDLVTCADWQNIWLNEGFASYFEYLAVKNLQGEKEGKNWRNEAIKLAKSNLSGSVLVTNDMQYNDNRIFDLGLSYKKGALVLQMLRHEINNDSIFFDIFRSYLAKFKYSNTITDDFKAKVKEKTHVDYGYFFNQWVYGKGYPEFTTSWYYRNDTLYIESFEKGTDPGTPLFKVSKDYLIHFYSGKDSTIRLTQNEPLNLFKVKFSRPVKSIVSDPDSLILMTDTVIGKYTVISEINIYPNPCYDSLCVEFKNSDNIRHFEIYDMKGNKKIDTDIEKNPSCIDMRSLVMGTYVLRIINNGNSYITKVIRR
jgi:aminopeptidase N